jgi:hypothetical protein
MTRTGRGSFRAFRTFGVGVVCAAVFFGAATSHANETDQFLLPVDETMADVGVLLSNAHYHVLEDFVTKANEMIRAANRGSGSASRTSELERWHAPVTIADHVRAAFGQGFVETLELENVLRSGGAKALYAPGIASYKTSNWIYEWVHLPIDPRKIPLAVPSSTICAFDSYVGTDKLGHFHDLGHIYFKDFISLRSSGVSDEDALKRVVKNYSRGIISETAAIGYFATGVCSNADLAANYLGFKFYLNLTEPVMLQGVVQPPLLVRHGDYWSLNTHVRPESGFFRIYVSDHMNEALNPCLYEWGAEGPIARKLEDHADQILTFYADEHGNQRPKAWFEAKAESLVLYYGEDYGHTGLEKADVTIAKCCFGEEDEEGEPAGEEAAEK